MKLESYGDSIEFLDLSGTASSSNTAEKATKYFMERYVHDLGTKIEETIHSLWKQYSSEQPMLSQLAEK